MFRRVNLAGWSLVLVAATAVEVCVHLFDLDDSVAAPSATARALVQGMSSGALSGEVATTLESYVQGLGLAIAVGVVGGVLIGSSRTLHAASSVVIEFLRPIPAVALIPAAVFVLGFDTPTRRFVIAFAAVWPILLNTIYGVRGTDRYLHDVAKTSGVGPVGRVVRVTLPAALPSIATGVRISASLALLVCVTVEFVIGTGGGIGSYMQEQRSAVRVPETYAAIVVVALLGYLVSAILRTTERRFLPWVGEEQRIGR
jgi:ABC-type nitrate/sulfonate/bicarbonate transport system permease component